MKQIIVMRTDLNMRKGKMVAQGAHASMGTVLAYRDDPRVEQWLADNFTKVCVRADSLDELMDVYIEGIEAGLLASLVTDNGLTEFHGEKTITCCAIGPDTPEKLEPITGSLKLL